MIVLPVTEPEASPRRMADSRADSLAVMTPGSVPPPPLLCRWQDSDAVARGRPGRPP